MRGVLHAAWLLPLALGSALPPQETEKLEKRTFDLVDDILAGLGSIKQDLMAGGAALNQQLYQAVQQPAQYKKCNPTNIKVRQEWSVPLHLHHKEFQVNRGSQVNFHQDREEGLHQCGPVHGKTAF